MGCERTRERCASGGRWFSDALLAAEGRPEGVQAILMHRTETLFALLLDRQRWINRPDAADRTANTCASNHRNLI